MEDSKMLHVVMYPWFAYGHMIPYIHLANKLAEKGHQVTLLLPNRAKNRLQSLNLHPSLLTLRAITVPQVPQLPLGTEDTSDIPELLEQSHLATAFDLTRPEFESVLTTLTPRPDLIFYDIAYWVPQLGFKSVCYNVISAKYMNTIINNVQPKPCDEKGEPINDLFGDKYNFIDRVKLMFGGCDAIAFRTCREVEGETCDELSRDYSKPCLLTGAVLPEPDAGTELEPRWRDWLAKFEVGSVVFCTFGTQIYLDKVQFDELLLGLEMTKLPFLLVVKPPKGYTTIEEAYPEGFKERVGDRGVVTSEWVQQPFILAHQSVGCFVNHCGHGTLWESLLSKNQLVLVPHQLPEQHFNAGVLVDKLKVAVQVEIGENGWVSKENLCSAVKCVMDGKNEIGNVIKMNQQMWRAKFAAPEFMDGYIEMFIKELKSLISIEAGEKKLKIQT